MHRPIATFALATDEARATSIGAFTQTAAPSAPAQPAQASSTSAPATCTGPVDPYTNYTCLDTYLGTGVFEPPFNYHKLEMDLAG